MIARVNSLGATASTRFHRPHHTSAHHWRVDSPNHTTVLGKRRANTATATCTSVSDIPSTTVMIQSRSRVLPEHERCGPQPDRSHRPGRAAPVPGVRLASDPTKATTTTTDRPPQLCCTRRFGSDPDSEPFLPGRFRQSPRSSLEPVPRLSVNLQLPRDECPRKRLDEVFLWENRRCFGGRIHSNIPLSLTVPTRFSSGVSRDVKSECRDQPATR